MINRNSLNVESFYSFGPFTKILSGSLRAYFVFLARQNSLNTFYLVLCTCPYQRSLNLTWHFYVEFQTNLCSGKSIVASTIILLGDKDFNSHNICITIAY